MRSAKRRKNAARFSAKRCAFSAWGGGGGCSAFRAVLVFMAQETRSTRSTTGLEEPETRSSTWRANPRRGQGLESDGGVAEGKSPLHPKRSEVVAEAQM